MRRNKNIIKERENLQHKNHIAGKCLQEIFTFPDTANAEVAYKGLPCFIEQQGRTEREGLN